MYICAYIILCSLLLFVHGYSRVAPSKVKNLAAVALGSTSVGLSWMAPLQPNGIITKYCVRYRSDSRVINHSGAVVLLHNVTSTTIGNLQEYTTYTFRVFGETVGGKGGAVRTTVTLFPAGMCTWLFNFLT